MPCLSSSQEATLHVLEGVRVLEMADVGAVECAECTVHWVMLSDADPAEADLTFATQET